MKTLKVEGVYPMAFESEEDIACHLPGFIDSYNERRLAVAAIVLKPLLDQRGKLVELRSAHRRCASVARRHRKLKHLPHALA